MLFVNYKPTEIRSDLQRIGERNSAWQCLIAIFENWSVTRERVKKKEKLINIYKFARQQKCFPWHFYKANVLSFFLSTIFNSNNFYISPKNRLLWSWRQRVGKLYEEKSCREFQYSRNPLTHNLHAHPTPPFPPLPPDNLNIKTNKPGDDDNLSSNTL